MIPQTVQRSFAERDGMNELKFNNQINRQDAMYKDVLPSSVSQREIARYGDMYPYIRHCTFRCQYISCKQFTHAPLNLFSGEWRRKL